MARRNSDGWWRSTFRPGCPAGTAPATQTGGGQVPFARVAKIDFKDRRARFRFGRGLFAVWRVRVGQFEMVPENLLFRIRPRQRNRLAVWRSFGLHSQRGEALVYVGESGGINAGPPFGSIRPRHAQHLGQLAQNLTASSQDRDRRDLDALTKRITKPRLVEPRGLVGSFVVRARRSTRPSRPAIYHRQLRAVHNSEKVELPVIARVRSEPRQLLGPRFGDRVGKSRKRGIPWMPASQFLLLTLGFRHCNVTLRLLPLTELLQMAMTNAERQARYRARHTVVGNRPIPERVTEIEAEVAKLKLVVSRLDQRQRNQARRRTAETLLEPSEARKHYLQVLRYVEEEKALGRVPRKLTCARETGLTRGIVQYHWDTVLSIGKRDVTK
jgi:hypothetical protein